MNEKITKPILRSGNTIYDWNEEKIITFNYDHKYNLDRIFWWGTVEELNHPLDYNEIYKKGLMLYPENPMVFPVCLQANVQPMDYMTVAALLIPDKYKALKSIFSQLLQYEKDKILAELQQFEIVDDFKHEFLTIFDDILALPESIDRPIVKLMLQSFGEFTPLTFENKNPNTINANIVAKIKSMETQQKQFWKDRGLSIAGHHLQTGQVDLRILPHQNNTTFLDWISKVVPHIKPHTIMCEKTLILCKPLQITPMLCFGWVDDDTKICTITPSGSSWVVRDQMNKNESMIQFMTRITSVLRVVGGVYVDS